MPPRALLSEAADREDYDDRQRLRHLERRFEDLLERRRTLLGQMRQLSSEQKSLYDRRHGPQAEVEKLHEEHAKLGRRLAELRSARDVARGKVEEAVIRRRELLLTFDRAERERPEQIRREIAELELQQQTRAVKIDEENAMIARLRKRTADLKEAEGRAATVAEHERLRKEADLAVTAAREEVERISREMVSARSERETKMVEIRKLLENAGSLVAELRAKGVARRDVMAEVDACSKELAEVDREGRELLARTRARRAEAQKTLRQYARPRRSGDEALASIAEAHLEELMKRGKVTL